MLDKEFDRHADLEDNHWWFKARRLIINTVLRRFSPSNFSHLVEIGCGTGGNLKYLSQYYQYIYGVDISPLAVKYARNRVSGEIHQGEFDQVLESHWNKLQIILLADVIEHVENDLQFIQTLIHSMQPGAILLITAPAHPDLWSPHDVALGHQRRYTLKSFNSLWTSQPVETLFVTPINCLLCPLIFMARWFNKSDKPTQSDLKLHNAFVNFILYGIFAVEKYWLKYLKLPWGCSYLALLRKTDHET